MSSWAMVTERSQHVIHGASTFDGTVRETVGEQEEEEEALGFAHC